MAYFQLSGGTTGTPKLIPRTHNDYYYSVRRSVDNCSSHNRRATCARSRRLITTHQFTGIVGGLRWRHCRSAADPSATFCFPLIEKHQVNVTALVPPAVSLWSAGTGWRRKPGAACLAETVTGRRRPSFCHPCGAIPARLAVSCSRCLAWRRAGELHPS
ncbi:AMP-binding protein [Shigella sonnei]